MYRLTQLADDIFGRNVNVPHSGDTKTNLKVRMI